MSDDPWTPPTATAPAKSRFPKYGTAAYEEFLDRLDRTRAIRCYHCGYLGQTLHRHSGFRPYHLLLVLVGVGILLILMAARATTPTCPQCGSTDEIEPYDGAAVPGAETTWANAEIESQNRLRAHQLALLGSVTFLFLVLVLYLAQS